MLRIQKLIVIGFTFYVNCVYAGTMGLVSLDSAMPKENIYVGLGVGGSFNKDKYSVYGQNTNRTTSANLSNNRWVGNLYIGYGHTFDTSWFLGVEANTYFPYYSTNATTIGVSSPEVYNSYFTNHEKFNDYLGLDFLPGCRVNHENLIYARLGIGFRDYTISQNARSLNDNSYYYDSQVVGGRFGVGITHAWTTHLASSVDYFYSYYPTYNAELWEPINLEQSFKSSANYIGISLVYTI